MDVYCNRTHGAYVQTKGSSIVFNFGDADPEFGKMQGKELQNTLGSVLAAFPVVVRTGKGYVEACHQVPPRLTACTLHPPPATRLPPPATRHPPPASRLPPPPFHPASLLCAPTPAPLCLPGRQQGRHGGAHDRPAPGGRPARRDLRLLRGRRAPARRDP